LFVLSSKESEAREIVTVVLADKDADDVEDEGGKNLSGTGDTGSSLMGWVGVEGAIRGEGEGEDACDDAGVRIPLLRPTDFRGVAGAAITLAVVATAARAVSAIAFCFFASFSKLWSTVN